MVAKQMHENQDIEKQELKALARQNISTSIVDIVAISPHYCLPILVQVVVERDLS